MNGLLPVTHPPTGAKNAVPVQFAPVYTVTAAQVSHDSRRFTFYNSHQAEACTYPSILQKR
jgi:hypothetical protein